MQIAEKYRKDYAVAIAKIRDVRRKFMEELQKLSYLRVMPSQANYVMCELLDGIRSDELAYDLLRKNILIKDLSQKLGNGRQYIRLAVRRKEENDYLVQCLKAYYNERQ